MGELEGGGGPATDSPAISKDKQHATSAFSSGQPFFSSLFSPLFVSSNLSAMFCKYTQTGSMLFFIWQPLITESLQPVSQSVSATLFQNNDQKVFFKFICLCHCLTVPRQLYW